MMVDDLKQNRFSVQKIECPYLNKICKEKYKVINTKLPQTKRL